MTCERAREIDVDAFLVDSGAPAFADFRSHYVDCDACAETVADWFALGLAVEQAFVERQDTTEFGLGGSSGHPNAERLRAILQWRESGSTLAMPEALTPEIAAKVELHVESCLACQTNLRLMSRFDPAVLTTAVRREQSATGDRASEGGLIESLQNFWVSVSESLFSPDIGSRAFPAMVVGMAAIVLLGLWLSGQFGLIRSNAPSPTGVEIVETTPPEIEKRREPPVAEAVPHPSQVEQTPDAVELAHVPPVVPTTPDPDPRLAPKPVPTIEDPTHITTTPDAEPLPDLSPEPSPAPPSTEESFPPEPRRASGPEEILLASLDHLDQLRYAVPDGPHEIGWMQQLRRVRGTAGVASAEVRAPIDHVGLTLKAAPRLWWQLTETTDQPVEFVVIAGGDALPLVETLLTGPKTAGLNSVDLADYGVELRPDTDYRWFVSVVDDPDRPSSNVTTAGALRLVPEGDARRAQLAEAEPTERGLTLARLGLWYDAYDFYASLAEQFPQDQNVAALRDRLAKLASASR